MICQQLKAMTKAETLPMVVVIVKIEALKYFNSQLDYVLLPNK